MSQGSSGEKTELPTPKKLRDARKKGQVARSQEVVTTVSLSAVIGYLWLAWGAVVERLASLFDRIAAIVEGDFRSTVHAGLITAAWDMMVIMLPILGISLAAGIAANCMQFGMLFSFESIKPKMEKVSPAKGFKRIFSKKQVVELLKSVLKIVFLSVLLFFVLRDALGGFLNAARCGMPCLVDITGVVLLQTLMFSALAFVIVALADLAYQRRAHTKSLMMTKEEVKREYKESEGDPIIKGKRRQLAQELAMSDSGHVARKGTAVVVNPTHFAVVLSYRPDEYPLPLVTAKGRNIQAYYLRTQAEEAGVPVFRNVVLARSLFASTEVDQPVPDELFDAVAEVLVWVTRNRHLLYSGPLDHGVIDMDAGDHRLVRAPQEARGGMRHD